MSGARHIIEVAISNARRVVTEFTAWMATDEAPDVDVNLMAGVMSKGAEPVVQVDWIESRVKQSGHGTRALAKLCAIADRHQAAIELEIGGGETDPDVLISWYKQYGFNFVNGASYMRRDPRPVVTESTVATEYPRAGPVVDGLTVRKDVPNMSSISASLTDYRVLPGIRVVPLSDFNAHPRALFYAANDLRRVDQLAVEIKESGELNPLIVVTETAGPYILEGGHRLGALHLMGINHFPALVVVNEEDDSVTESVTGLPYLGQCDRIPQTVTEALKVRVPPFAQSAFFQNHGAPEEFWAFKAAPSAKPGDAIEFYFGSKPVATAKVSRVEQPGQSNCGHSGRFKDKWKVHWKDASFKRL